MFVFKFPVLISLIFLSCQTEHDRLRLRPIFGSKDRGSTWERQVVAQCVLFGEATTYLDCLLVLPNEERFISVSEVSILTKGSDGRSSLSTDRRLSGEDLYSARFHYRPTSQSETGWTARGLPRIVSGDIFRGVPGNGGTALMKGIVFRIDRELYWGKSGQGLTSSLYFAFRDASSIWAVPLTKHLDTGKAILSIRVLDRMNQEDISRLESGTLIAMEYPGTRGKTMFRFLYDSAGYQTSDLHRESHIAEIIEE